MPLTETSGSVTMDGSEDILINDTTQHTHAAWVFLNAMASGDTIIIKSYVYDTFNAILRLYSQDTYQGVQTLPAVFFPPVPITQFKVTAQQTTGTNRAVSWNHEVY